jgi:hypothetical protein
LDGARTDALTAGEILDLADAGQSGDPVTRGRLLLAAARPEWPAALGDRVSLGDRDACVLELRCATFGEQLDARTVCPGCGAQLALQVVADTLRRTAAPAAPVLSPVFSVDAGGFSVQARSPDAVVMAAAAATGDHALARRALIDGCVVAAVDASGVRVRAETLPDDVVAAVGDAIVAQDPQADVRMKLTCAACGHAWTCRFDAVGYLVAELDNLAVHLVEDVHTLAAAYGWTEEEVLALPSRRRRRYVERALGV